MTSGFKLTETQLVSIYKLEFYKNKKNWKLYEDVKTEPPRPPSPKTTNKLKKTYSVKEFPEPEYDVEQVSPHNQAFLHEEPDDAPDPQSPDDVTPSLPAPLQPLSRPHSLLEQTWSEVKTEAPWGDIRPIDPCTEQTWSGHKTAALCEDPYQDWCGAEAEGMRDQLAYDQCDGACQQDTPWKPATHLQLKPAVDPLDLHTEYLTPAQMKQTAEDWLTMHGCPVWQEEYADTYEEYGLLDESADFVRGAHCAPHSSEIDLSITQECPCTGNNSLCVLTVRQLSRAIQRHHSALTLLLREQALRERLSCRSLLHPPIPFEDYPTRDTDPLRPPDSVLSGSHRLLSAPGHGADTGRGRGRLQQHRIIGIGMGRPYRL